MGSSSAGNIPRIGVKWSLTLTGKGLALWRKVLTPYEEGVEQIFGALPTSHRQRFLEDLKAIHDSLLAVDGKADADRHWSSHFLREQVTL